MLRTNILVVAFIFSISSLSIAQNVSIIPFFTFDNLILIPSKIEGKVGYLILDTGAEKLTLNKRYFNDEKNTQENLTARGFNGNVEEVLVRTTELQIEAHSWNDQRALVIDLEHLKPARDFTILGLAGIQLFDAYEILFDFKTSKLILFELDAKGNVINTSYQKNLFDITFPFKLKGHIPSIEINVGSNVLRMGLDSGSAIALIHPKFKSTLKDKLLYLKDVHLQGTDQKITSAKLWKMEGINISMLSFPPLDVAFININRFNSMLWGSKLDGILGMDFLRQFMTSINTKKKEMHIWMNANATVQIFQKN